MTATTPPAARNGRREATLEQLLADDDAAAVRDAAGRRAWGKHVLDALAARLDEDQPTNVGFPSAFDLDYSLLDGLAGRVLNNVGDPFADSAFPANTKAFERQVVDMFADLLHAPEHDRWGFVTSGGYHGVRYGLLNARRLHPGGIVYYSNTAHFCVRDVVDELGMAAVTIGVDATGAMDLEDLAAAAAGYRDRPAIVVATIGTTMTEAVDDVPGIRAVLAAAHIHRSYIHADAAFSGLPLVLLPVGGQPRFDLGVVESVSVSGHKLLGTPMPSGVVVVRASQQIPGRWIDYVDTAAATLSSSRSGHAPLYLWWALKVIGVDVHRDRVEQARRVAGYAVYQLNTVGVRAWRHPHAMTVVLDRPVDPAGRRWWLATTATTSHLVCVPGVTTAQIDALCADITAAGTPAAAGVPRQIRRPVPATPATRALGDGGSRR